MPLDQFINETLDVLATDADEILVEAAKPLRPILAVRACLGKRVQPANAEAVRSKPSLTGAGPHLSVRPTERKEE